MAWETDWSRPSGKMRGVWVGVSKRTDVSADALAHPWLVRCPAPLCFYNVSATTEVEAKTKLDTHPCPWYGGQPTTIGWTHMVEAYLQRIWKLLDIEVDIIKDGHTTNLHQDQAKNRAKGLAYALAILMPPFFQTPEEISREALKRWEMRQAGTEYTTQGLGLKRLARLDASAATMPGLTQAQIDAIKFAKESGMFTDQELANTYDLTVGQLQLVIGS